MLLRLPLCILLAIVVPACLALVIQPRKTWTRYKPRFAHIPKADTVLIHHTAEPGPCFSAIDCKKKLRKIQDYHRNSLGWDDIGYNFVVTGDNNVYEGRGFGIKGSHSRPYNSRSIGIAFMGNFEEKLPSRQMLQNAKDLIKEAVRRGYLTKDYQILGHRQASSTLCPGDRLFNELKKWPHWNNTSIQVDKRLKVPK